MLPEQATGQSLERAEFHRRGDAAFAVKVYASNQYSQKGAEPFELLVSKKWVSFQNPWVGI